MLFDELVPKIHLLGIRHHGPRSARQVVRELDGVDIIGADLVEVSPPFDPNGGTAWLGVSIMFELLCVMAKNISDKNQ